MRHTLAVFVSVTVLRATVLAAQTGAIRGTVHVAGDTGRRVAGAEIVLSPGGKATRTDSAGRFVFAGLATATYAATARHVGFEPAGADARVVGGGEVTVSIAIRFSAQAMSEIVIRGARVRYPARYAEAYKRAARDNGRFFTRENIDSLRPLDVKGLLQSIPGVLVNDRGVTFQRCQAGLVGPLGTGSMTPARPDISGATGPSPNSAHVQVYVDGSRWTSYTNPTSPLDADHVLKEISPAAIQIMEVYSGVGRIPGEYLDDACAVILIWRR